jgi:hypothetical protein
MVSGIRLRVALAAAALISASSLALADSSSGPKALNDSQMDLVTGGAEAGATATGGAEASGPLASTATVANTTASSDGTSAVAGGVGAGVAIAPQGTKAADSSVTVRADGPAQTIRRSNTTDTPNSSVDFTIAIVLTSPVLAR